MHGKTRFKNMGLGGVLTIEEDVELIKWTLVYARMQIIQ
jgi:hypothetical protein